MRSHNNKWNMFYILVHQIITLNRWTLTVCTNNVFKKVKQWSCDRKKRSVVVSMNFISGIEKESSFYPEWGRFWSIKSSLQIDKHSQFVETKWIGVNIFCFRGSVNFQGLINGPGPGRNYGETAVSTFSKSFQSIQPTLHQIQLSHAACSYNNSWAVVIVSIIKERAQSAQYHVLEIKEEMRIYNR